MKALEELFRDGDELVRQIEELEGEQELNDFGSYAYDQTDMEIQYLSAKLDRLKREIEGHYG